MAGCFWARLVEPGSALSGSARRSAMTLLGTAEVDCRLLEAVSRSSGDKEREASDLEERSEPSAGAGLWEFLGRANNPPP